MSDVAISSTKEGRRRGRKEAPSAFFPSSFSSIRSSTHSLTCPLVHSGADGAAAALPIRSARRSVDAADSRFRGCIAGDDPQVRATRRCASPLSDATGGRGLVGGGAGGRLGPTRQLSWSVVLLRVCKRLQRIRGGSM